MNASAKSRIFVLNHLVDFNIVMFNCMCGLEKPNCCFYTNFNV